MKVYRSGVRGDPSLFRDRRINHKNCEAMLDAGLCSEVVLRLSPEELPELQPSILENSRIVKGETTRRIGPYTVNGFQVVHTRK